MTAVVVDTNVGIAANGKSEQAGPECVKACITALHKAVRSQIIVLDRGMRILAEYRRHLSPSGQPGVGDAFFKFVWLNQTNPERCESVEIRPIDPNDDDFEEFPRDPLLAAFDRSDRKFAAVALASRFRPHVLNATDTDWWTCRHALRKHGLRLKFLCPSLMDS